jgi:hypothetical protein
MSSQRVSAMRRVVSVLAVCSMVWGLASAYAQSSSSSSSSLPGEAPSHVQQPADNQPRVSGPEAGGAAITLETREPLFDIATALNTCGYNRDLANSEPIRSAIRGDVAQEISASPKAAASRDALCSYMREHELSDKAQQTAQYVSLALYLSPVPELEPIVGESSMPPDALQVVNVLPLLHNFAEAVSLHAIWLKHRHEYEAILDKVHDPITRMILNTNVYLRVPVSSYQTRRLLILVEPMLAPNSSNARIYGDDYTIVTSPTAAGTIAIDQIRHLYLHFEIEPYAYSHTEAMQRLLPLLKPEQDAPVSFVYKSDVVALVTECLIKAIEARTLDPGLPVPQKPTATRVRTELARYDEEMSAYNRQADEIRRRLVALDMRQGWTLVGYFYNELATIEKSPEGLSESIGRLIYGMDVEHQAHVAAQIQFLPVGSGEFVARVASRPTGLMLAEKLMLQGKLDEAGALADKTLADPHADHPAATYMKAQIALMQNDPEQSATDFTQVLSSSKDPQTLAWSHVYLGRLYDTSQPAERSKAVVEYKSALAIAGIPPGAQQAAQAGLKAPFAIPRVKHENQEPLDPTGKAEKDSYKPDEN